jgi:emfourin
LRLELRISGGFAGLRRPPLVLDTTGLAEAERAEVERLAEAVLAQEHPGPPGPDRFQYDLRADGREARLHEGALTPEAEALVSRLGG